MVVERGAAVVVVLELDLGPPHAAMPIATMAKRQAADLLDIKAIVRSGASPAQEVPELPTPAVKCRWFQRAGVTGIDGRRDYRVGWVGSLGRRIGTYTGYLDFSPRKRSARPPDPRVLHSTPRLSSREHLLCHIRVRDRRGGFPNRRDHSSSQI